MGRKSNPKSKEKRQQRKEEQMRIGVSQAVVDKANKLKDPLEPFPIFRKYERNGLTIDLSMQKVAELSEDVKKWLFDLTKKNMQKMYEMCSWGWKDRKKWEEMTDDSAWYLLAKNGDDLVGFSHFRFDMDYGDEVLYCYELQLEESVQRKGLGKFMMQVLELVAFSNNLKKVVLTILKNNDAGNFYKAINYEVDETSPEDDEEEEFPYEILSKKNKKLLGNSTAAHNHNGNCCGSH